MIRAAHAAVLLAQAAAVGVLSSGLGAVIGASVGGLFLVVNSVLTIYLTRKFNERYDRRAQENRPAEDPPPRRKQPPGRPDRDRSADPRGN